MTEETIELQDFLKVISKFRWLIVLGTLVCLMTAVAATSRMAPVYEASIQLLVNQNQVVYGGSQTAGEAYQAILTSERLAKTFSQMIQNRSTAEKVIEQLGIPILPIDLTGKIKSEPVRDTQLIKVTVQDKNPARAQQIANTLGTVFEKLVEDIETKNRRSDKTQPLVSISVVEPAIEPLEPVKPKPLLNAILALFIGIVASTGLAFLLNHLDATVKEVEEIEQLSGLVSLGRIPTIQKGGDELVVEAAPRSVVAEAFRTLKTNIQYINFESTIKVALVTSADVGDGKTMFSANLAAVIARSDQRVLVVGCDLRRPRIHNVFNLNNDVGLANILVGNTSIEKAVQKTEIEGLDVIAGGPTPPNPVNLLESKNMKKFLEDARQRYDFIILDSPPITAVTDALVLAGLVDGTIMVTRYGVTNKHAFTIAKAALDKVGAPILGFVLNAANGNKAYGYYGYYHKEYTDEGYKPQSKKRWIKLFGTSLLVICIVAIIGGAIRFSGNLGF